MTIVAIASSSETTMTKKTMISSKKMMTIVTIVSSSKTMMVIRTMIINKEMLTVASSKEAIDDIEDNDWK